MTCQEVACGDGDGDRQVNVRVRVARESCHCRVDVIDLLLLHGG